MPDKTWKAVERRVAARLGTVRSGPLGKRDSDVIHPRLAVEIKYRSRLPRWAMACLEQASHGLSASGKAPIVVMAQKGMDTDDYLVVIRLADFIKLTNDVAG